MKMDQRIEAEAPQPGEVGTLLGRIGNGLKTIASDEVKLARIELIDQLKKPLADAGAIVLGGVLAIIGVGLLCTTVVVALEPLIPALWLRMVIMSVVYFVGGSAVMRLYVNRFQRDATPGAPRALLEAKRTVEAVKAEVSDD
jgi:uncharacterized membrane protein YqjE